MLMLLHNAHACAVWSNVVLILASLLQGKQYPVNVLYLPEPHTQLDWHCTQCYA